MEHHQITPRKHLKPTDEARLECYGEVGLPPSPTPEHIDFPRLRELVEETASILDDEDFFRQINERIPMNVLQHWLPTAIPYPPTVPGPAEESRPL